MSPPRVIDSHVHFWDPSTLPYPWLASVPRLNRSFLPSDLAADAGTVAIEALVFVEAGREPDRNLDEARWVTRLAEREPRIQAIVAHAPLELGAAVESDLAALASLPLVKGVRRLLQDEPDDRFCLRPGFVEGIRRLARFGFSADLCIYHRQLPAVLELVRQCPEIAFVLDHVAKPPIRDRLLDPWRSHLEDLARFPNVVCKISGMVTEADHAGWQPSDLRPYVEHVVDRFGFGRVLYGSDWPVATLATEYSRWVETLTDLLGGANSAERDAFFHGNARRCYRLA